MAAIPEIQSIRDSDTLSGLLALAERKDAAEAAMARDFIKAMEAGEPLATPEWAGMVPDYDAARAQRIPFNAVNKPMRAYTVAECLSDALDFAKGPNLVDVVRLLSLAMKGTDPIVALAARQLVQRAARKWAEHYTPEVEA